MKCLAIEQIAEAATTRDVARHLDECLDCKRLVTEQSSLRGLLTRLPTPQLTTSRRRELAAEVLAAADVTPRRPAVPRIAMVCGIGAAAAVAILWLGLRDTESSHVELAATSTSEEIAISSRQIAMLDPVPTLPAARVDDQQAQLTRESDAGRDVLRLTDGVVTVDSRDTRDVDVRVAQATVHIAEAKVRVHARHGVITTVQVIVGSAELVTASKRVQLERGEIWSAEPALDTRSIRAFRDGWVALRAGRNLEAITLFDTATDPMVAEDAAYWAAIAARRAGSSDATHRMTEFMSRYPHSPHAEQAAHLLAP